MATDEPEMKSNRQEYFISLGLCWLFLGPVSNCLEELELSRVNIILSPITLCVLCATSCENRQTKMADTSSEFIPCA